MPHSPDHMHDGADSARSGVPTGQRRVLKTWKNDADPSQKEATEITTEEALERQRKIDEMNDEYYADYDRGY